MSLIITYIISFALGITSGRYSYSLTDYTVQIFNYLMLAIPSFIAGVFAILFFSFELQWFPFQGSVDINLKEGTFEYYMSKIYHTFFACINFRIIIYCWLYSIFT